MATSQKGIGVPIKLMHEAEGHVITVELKGGEMYRGELFDAEDNWNCQLKDVTATGRDGRVSQLDHIFVRGRCVCLSAWVWVACKGQEGCAHLSACVPHASQERVCMSTHRGLSFAWGETA